VEGISIRFRIANREVHGQPFSYVTNVQTAVIDIAQVWSNLYERLKHSHSLQAEGGNRSETARELGITRKTLHKKLQKYGVT
jgi:DNA-binding NtrC family response regulator